VFWEIWSSTEAFKGTRPNPHNRNQIITKKPSIANHD